MWGVGGLWTCIVMYSHVSGFYLSISGTCTPYYYVSSHLSSTLISNTESEWMVSLCLHASEFCSTNVRAPDEIILQGNRELNWLRRGEAPWFTATAWNVFLFFGTTKPTPVQEKGNSTKLFYKWTSLWALFPKKSCTWVDRWTPSYRAGLNRAQSNGVVANRIESTAHLQTTTHASAGLSALSKRALARLVKARSWEPAAREFDSRLATKKILSSVSYPKYNKGSAFLTGDGPLCTGGAGVRGISRPVWECLLLNTMPWGHSSPRVKSFFMFVLKIRSSE